MNFATKISPLVVDSCTVLLAVRIMDSLANFSFTNPKISLSGKGGGGGGFLFVEKCSVRLISGRFGDRSNVGVC
jgi:hypothetical protein